MSVETTVETAEVSEVGVPAPETTPAETHEDTSPETPEGTPSEDTAPAQKETPPALSEHEAQLLMYQEVLAKHQKNSNYDMSDEEADAFIAIQEKIATGEIEEPGPVELEEEKTSTETDETKTPPPSGKEETSKEDLGLDGISTRNEENIREAMRKVGAKDISELSGKIDGLLTTMKSSGGKLGSELAEAKKREANHQAWLNDLSSGKPAALEYLKKVMGTDKVPTVEKGETLPDLDDTDGDPNDFLDDKLAREVLSLKKLINSQQDTIQKLSKGSEKIQKEDLRRQAADGWVDDIVDLVVKNQKDFSLSPVEARALGKEYWGPDGHTKPVHPKFQQVHELIKFAHDRRMPDLQTAHIVWHHENGTYAKKLVQATKEGQQAVQHKPSTNSAMSNKQSRTKTNVPQPNIDDARVGEMERGNLDAIPDEWMDNSGNLIPDRVPERFHRQAFGRLGKPQ